MSASRGFDRPRSRRGFLCQSALAAGVLALTLPARPAWSAEPIERPGEPKFKFSLAAYSYRALLSGANPQMDLLDFLADCAAMQLDGAELTGYYFPDEPSAEYFNRLRHTAFRLGLGVSGTAIGNEFTLPPGPQRDAQIAHCKRWVDYAVAMGAPVIRVFAGRQQPNQTPEEAHRLVVQGLEECCAYAGERGIFLALENHGGVTTQIADLVRMVQAVDSRWMGINLDTGNLHGSESAEAGYADIAKMAPYAINVQVKVMLHLAGRNKVEADLARKAQILRDSGYRGYIVLEYEEGGDPRKESARWMDRLREAFAG